MMMLRTRSLPQTVRSTRNRRLFVSGLLATAAFVAASLASAATHQVGPDKPFKDLSSVAAQLRPADVVEVDGGQTYMGGVVFSEHGTPTQKITIRGVPVEGKLPVISGGNNVIEAAGDYYVFENLEITGGSQRGFFHHAHDITLRKSVVHDNPAHGILGADTESGSLLLDSVEVYGNGEGTQKHQVYMATDETMHPDAVFRMQNCYVHDGNGGNNIKSRAGKNEIYYNWIENAHYQELELIGTAEHDADAVVEDGDVVGNVIISRKTSSHAMRLGGDGTGESNGTYRFVNNTIIAPPEAPSVFWFFDGIKAVELTNNIIAPSTPGRMDLTRDTEARWLTGAAAIKGTKNWLPADAENVPAGLTETITGTDPGFANAAQGDLSPRPDSPTMNAGAPQPPIAVEFEPPKPAQGQVADLKARANDGKPDLGAFECPGAQPPAPGQG